MPKGQRRDEATRIRDIENRLKTLKDRKTDLENAAADKAKRLRQRRAFLIGETILDARLTHEEKAVICGIMSRRESKPADWDKVSEFTVHVVREAPSLRQAAPDFVRTGK
jgi:hypothetical protein